MVEPSLRLGQHRRRRRLAAARHPYPARRRRAARHRLRWPRRQSCLHHRRAPRSRTAPATRSSPRAGHPPRRRVGVRRHESRQRQSHSHARWRADHGPRALRRHAARARHEPRRRHGLRRRLPLRQPDHRALGRHRGDGGATAGPCTVSGATMPGGLPAPNANVQGTAQPEVGLIVRFNNVTNHWEDEPAATGTAGALHAADLDVFRDQRQSPARRRAATGELRARRHRALQHGHQPGEREGLRLEHRGPQRSRFEGPGTLAGHSVRGTCTRRASPCSTGRTCCRGT